MPEPERRCAKCGAAYGGDLLFCPADGTPLASRPLGTNLEPLVGQTLREESVLEALIGVGAMASVAGPGGSGRTLPYLVFEILEGHTLRSALSAAGGTLPLGRGEAHENHIVHRDLKPENAMLLRFRATRRAWRRAACGQLREGMAMMSAQRVASLLLALVVSILESPARADEIVTGDGTNPAPHRLVSGFAAMTRPVGIAEGNVSLLTLPGAEVCVERSAGCKRGDLVFALEGWEIYRWNSEWAFGAGVMLGLLPTAHPRQPPETIPRDHTRSYLTFEGMLRYYPYVGERVEVWGGVFGGLVVVNDRFQVDNGDDDRALLGTQGVTVRTEGGSIGLATGLAYGLTDHWSLLGSLRFSQWFLSWTPARDPLGSEASLSGRNNALTLSLGVAYRVAL